MTDYYCQALYDVHVHPRTPHCGWQMGCVNDLWNPRLHPWDLGETSSNSSGLRQWGAKQKLSFCHTWNSPDPTFIPHFSGSISEYVYEDNKIQSTVWRREGSDMQTFLIKLSLALCFPLILSPLHHVISFPLTAECSLWFRLLHFKSPHYYQ